MLNSLYEKAIAKRGNIQNIESENNVDSQLEWNWFERPFKESTKDFSIAAGDGSFNKKKFLTTNFCAVGAESIIYDGEIKKIDDADIFEISHISFLDELLGNYMSIYELKCALRSIEEYDVDYYLFDGSILGDLENAFPKGAKLPSKIKDNLDESLLNEFDRRLKLTPYGFVFPQIKDRILADVSVKKEYENREDFDLHLASVEKIILLKKLLENKTKIISIAKTSSDNNLFGWNIPDIAFLDKFTKKQGISKIEYRRVFKNAAFPYFNDFFKQLKFTIFYVRLQDNKNVLKVELPYKASEMEVLDIVEKINVLSVQGYPYLLNKAHNDVVITDRNMKELLKIAKIYETTNREVMSW
ncbi:MAG: DNA double-strand break repair nuclease NurA [Methanobrevibacter sp.]|uniref:DNA double-strand break repair nuclease NurA n=1 Tax=Methanobrevibacter sp. TaxID=66852 RepID=UPI0025EFA121|nr:DNA double-strand break repair nuclease NurA [Methanobrevibacter sp.]MBQ6099925.1 DNA double-strand break repair nuclease NurA [Methanobrevibacter sp.]